MGGQIFAKITYLIVGGCDLQAKIISSLPPSTDTIMSHRINYVPCSFADCACEIDKEFQLIGLGPWVAFLVCSRVGIMGFGRIGRKNEWN